MKLDLCGSTDWVPIIDAQPVDTILDNRHVSNFVQSSIWR
jgi:hypothetical protein